MTLSKSDLKITGLPTSHVATVEMDEGSHWIGYAKYNPLVKNIGSRVKLHFTSSFGPPMLEGTILEVGDGLIRIKKIDGKESFFNIQHIVCVDLI
tara:strand:- start:740 stop:1024 length:285 start_codon:yes stop_codon:yes gene_type:complete